MIKLFNLDCFNAMENFLLSKDIGENSFDCVWTDPPYFLSNGGLTCKNGKAVSVNKGIWDKSKGIEENHKFNKNWLSLSQRLLKPNGTIWVTGTHHTIFSVGLAMQELGFKILNQVTWQKPNPPPNLSCRYFTHSTETLIWAAKNEKSKHFFNYDLMRQINQGKQMKCVWDILPPKASEKLCGKHPTQKPISLVERCLLSSTKAEDLVLDPFMGSGTTGVVCEKLNLNFYGIEKDKSFFEIANNRIKKEQEIFI